MRTKKNETDNYNEMMVQCNINSIIAMAVDYADSFTVFRHDTNTVIDLSFGRVGDREYRSYSISVYTRDVCGVVGGITIMRNHNELLYRKDFDGYVDALETIFNIMTDESFNTNDWLTLGL